EIAENGDFRLKQVLMRGQNTKNSRDSVADLSLSVYFLFIRAVFRGAPKHQIPVCAVNDRTNSDLTVILAKKVTI
ncbi:MAG: hypothetical protein Q8Q40_13060, partial [Methylococcaceae bacterium]|nr:hypothetical protein [Methylococcaceae bacterium]MDP3904888.1 hypothetical protein [Methylococcaceae bacterium]